MKNHIFWAKQGVFYRIINVFLQNLLILPVSVTLSVLIALGIKSLFAADTVLTIKIVFLALNIIWVVRNSIVKVEKNAVIIRSIAGTKQAIEIDNISDLRVISYKDLRNIVLDTKAVNPLITNCAAFLVPMGNFIAFKNRFGRTVTIGVWNSAKLYQLLSEKSLSKLSDKEIHFSEKTVLKNSYDSSNGRLFKCFLKMPLKYYIITYFKCFYATIILPFFFSVFIPLMLKLVDVSLNPIIWVLLFIFISITAYLEIIRVVVDKDSKVIRLHLFYDNNKNVIKFDDIFDLKNSVSEAEIEELKKDKSKFVICTPHYKNCENEVIGFRVPNNIYVFLSVNKQNVLFNILRNASEEASPSGC